MLQIIKPLLMLFVQRLDLRQHWTDDRQLEPIPNSDRRPAFLGDDQLAIELRISVKAQPFCVLAQPETL